MKNILGTTENLELFDKEGRRVYNFRKDSDGYTFESTYDSEGNVLTFKDSNEFTRGFHIRANTQWRNW
jgi:hypothetical protein